MNQTWENAKKPNFGPDFGPFGPNLGSNFFPEFYLYQLLDSVLSYYPMQFKGKLKNQTWQNGKKTNFGSHFGSFGPNLGHKNFPDLYLY